ncbi:MAG: transposase [Pedobacter sp.]|nr:MAG: transposase [Pedobacter sp.]
MSAGGYKIWNKDGVYFISFATVGWVDVFIRKEYKDIVIESLCHCQKERGLMLYNWCLMSNHLHLIVSAEKGDLSDILRDFKKFTSKRLINAISEHPGESRREWMLALFKEAGAANSRNTNYQFWRQDNQPKECYSEDFIRQKVAYVHNNPVEAGTVEYAEDYLYSSARSINESGTGLLDLDNLW